MRLRRSYYKIRRHLRFARSSSLRQLLSILRSDGSPIQTAGVTGFNMPSPKYKVYRGKEYIGCVKDATDAAVLVSIQTEGSVRLGHSSTRGLVFRNLVFAITPHACRPTPQYHWSATRMFTHPNRRPRIKDLSRTGIYSYRPALKGVFVRGAEFVETLRLNFRRPYLAFSICRIDSDNSENFQTPPWNLAVRLFRFSTMSFPTVTQALPVIS